MAWRTHSSLLRLRSTARDPDARHTPSAGDARRLNQRAPPEVEHRFVEVTPVRRVSPKFLKYPLPVCGEDTRPVRRGSPNPRSGSPLLRRAGGVSAPPTRLMPSRKLKRADSSHRVGTKRFSSRSPRLRRRRGPVQDHGDRRHRSSLQECVRQKPLAVVRDDVLLA